MYKIDLNCDMGEAFGAWRAGDDAALLAHVSSANVACGFHAGDARTMAQTVGLSAEHGVALGAHPGLPDLQGFGRREMLVSPAEAYDFTVYQVGALKGFATAARVRLRHVKAHGALYNMAARDSKLSDAICRAIRDVDRDLIVYALSGSVMVDVARDLGMRVANEVFADRTYQDDGSLTPRRLPGALITDLNESITQVRTMIESGYVISQSGKRVAITADTVCLHGDQPHAPQFAKALRSALEDIGITIRAPQPKEV